MVEVRSHKDLIVWQKAIDLTVFVYQLTDRFPHREIYGLSSQMRRAAVSIASNIAEGRSRGTQKDFAHFLRMAYGSVSELETQLYICAKLNLRKNEESSPIDGLLTEISKMLHVMIKKLEARS